MRLDNVKLTAITPYTNNARNNSNTVESVKKSIIDFGFNVPMILNEDYVIVAGHTRFKALLEINAETGEYSEIPCHIMAIDAKKIAEYRIIDNKISDLSEWDLDKLSYELKSFQSIEEITENFGDNVAAKSKEAMGQSVTHVTQEAIDKKNDEIQDNFKHKGEEAAEDQVDFRCTHCHEIFSLRKEDIS